MPADKRRLSLEEAAELIFSTSSPTPEQVVRVRNLIVKGVLVGNTTGRGTTSAEAVAQYLAAASLNKPKAQRKGDKASSADDDAARRARAGERDLRPVYSDLMKDYFLAVVRKKDARRRSAGFQRAVLLGQVLAVGLVFVLIVGLVTGGMGGPSEIKAVESYLAANHQEAKIESWSPPKPAAPGVTLIHVKYSYLNQSGEREVAESVFSVQNDEVVSVTSGKR